MIWIYPHPVTVTTREIPCLVGNPYKPLFATVTGCGVVPKYNLQAQPNQQDKLYHCSMGSNAIDETFQELNGSNQWSDICQQNLWMVLETPKVRDVYTLFVIIKNQVYVF